MNMENTYSLKALARILKVCTRTIINWEQAGKIPKARKDPMSGYRMYSEDDVNELKRITGRG